MQLWAWLVAAAARSVALALVLANSPFRLLPCLSLFRFGGASRQWVKVLAPVITVSITTSCVLICSLRGQSITSYLGCPGVFGSTASVRHLGWSPVDFLAKRAQSVHGVVSLQCHLHLLQWNVPSGYLLESWHCGVFSSFLRGQRVRTQLCLVSSVGDCRAPMHSWLSIFL